MVVNSSNEISPEDTANPGQSDVNSVSRLLLHCPDITLKGKNQADFQNALARNVRHKLEHLNIHWNIKDSRGRIIIDVPPQSQSEIPSVLESLQQTPGISSLSVARYIRTKLCQVEDGMMNWPLLNEEIISLADDSYKSHSSFAVRVNRTDKTLPVTSQEIARQFGDAIRRHTQWDKVNLNRPDQIYYVDVYPDGMYCYTEKLKGVGGLPVGTGGRVLALLSGGIDSPVAAYSMTKRGCRVDFFHLSASHMPQQELEKSVIGLLACQLSRYTQRSRLYVAPYTYFDLALSGHKTGYDLSLFRRFMMRAAEALAGKTHSLALINGDSLGQVASQTLENLASSSRAVTIPIFRPLIGSNKDEIINIARKIGTYDISIEPYKDCCALISRQPKTRSRHEQLCEMESSIFPDYEDILEKTFQDMICLEYDCGRLVTSDK